MFELPAASSLRTLAGPLTLGSGNFTPGTDNAQDIGTSALRWRNLFGLTLNSGASTLTLTSNSNSATLATNGNAVFPGSIGVFGTSGGQLGLDATGQAGDIRLNTGSGGKIFLRDGGSGSAFFVSGGTAATTIKSTVADGAASVNVIIDSINALTTTAKALSIRNNAVEQLGIEQSGRLVPSGFLDNSGTPGNTTINALAGRAAIASAASSAVVTNNLVNANSVILVVMETSGVGVANIVETTRTAGTSFTVTSINGTGIATVTTGTAKFSFYIIN